MKTPFRFAADENGSALVIVFPPGVKGLFNSEIHGLVREVQERLDGVYVTYALSSAVVVAAATNDAVRFAERGTTGDWLLTVSPVHSELDAPAVVDAYLTAVTEAGRAA